jgi:hypothetical protein
MIDPKAEMERSVVAEAQDLVYGDRNHTYGHPFSDYTKTAALWSIILGVEVTVEKAILCMIALKISREMNLPNRDNRVDIAGYAECLQRCTELPVEDKEEIRQRLGMAEKVGQCDGFTEEEIKHVRDLIAGGVSD